jgi:hypothetical protein
MIEAEILYQWTELNEQGKPAFYALSVTGRLYYRVTARDDWIVQEPRPSACAKEMALLLRGRRGLPLLLPPDVTKTKRLVDGLREAAARLDHLREQDDIQR